MFTISAAARYDPGMVIAAAAALAATLVPHAPARTAPDRQARATVTILAAAPLRFSEIERRNPKVLRDSKVRRRDGSTEIVRLVEFE